MSEPQRAPDQAPPVARWQGWPGGVIGITADIATLVLLCGSSWTVSINRGERGYSDDIYLSDVHPRLWFALIFHLVLTVAGGLMVAKPRTRPFGQALLFTAGLGALALSCAIGGMTAFVG